LVFTGTRQAGLLRRAFEAGGQITRAFGVAGRSAVAIAGGLIRGAHRSETLAAFAAFAAFAALAAVRCASGTLARRARGSFVAAAFSSGAIGGLLASLTGARAATAPGLGSGCAARRARASVLAGVELFRAGRELRRSNRGQTQ